MSVAGDNPKPWNQGWDITENEREVFRERSRRSSAAKAAAMRGEGRVPLHDVNVPLLNPETLMPRLPPNGARSLSLFSGCGGLDLGFERAGFGHVASYDFYQPAATTLRSVRPMWDVFGGEEGDVTNVKWRSYRGRVDVLHGGAPCQPFSMAGRQLGKHDTRDMFPELVRAILEVRPDAFVAENVCALGHAKFDNYVKDVILGPLSKHYRIVRFELVAADFGVPQMRRRLIFVGFRSKRAFLRYAKPSATSSWAHLRDGKPQTLALFESEADNLPKTMGAREALGLCDIGYDSLAPIIRSSLTGPRHTTSVVSSVSALKMWNRLHIWPNGVSPTREQARLFVPENEHFRLSVPDCGLLQGFPETWPVFGSVYVALGQIGNAVAPPMAYKVAESVALAL
jgi:DNA (cytosine-5)-methyltransferase 1